MRFLLLAGEHNTLADREIFVQVPDVQSHGSSQYSFTCPDQTTAISIVSRLGCAYKLAQEVSDVGTDPDAIASVITSPTFSITDLAGHQSSHVLCQQIKDILGKSRFIISTGTSGLSPVVIGSSTVAEYLIDSAENIVYHTIWTHDYQHWIAKDRHMPKVNARAGMLPPKIARSMVNLIPFPDASVNPNPLLVDPFCGSGRVLIEASELGYRIAGIDIASEQIADTEANLRSLKITASLATHDAVHLSELHQNIYAIVTEPFLGKPNLRPDKAEFAAKGLKKLYLGCLKDWHKTLVSHGYIVMVFPILRGRTRDLYTGQVIDSVKNIGYNLLSQIEYSRPGADTRREIITLQKTT